MSGDFAFFALFGIKIVDRRQGHERDMVWRPTLAPMRAATVSLPRAAGLRLAGALAAMIARVLLHPCFAGVGVLWPFLP